MSRCIAVFIDFAYLARRSEHTTVSLDAMREALECIHEPRTIFVDSDVRPNGFGLPRQHSLVHYIRAIQQFGSPNSLCSSITESKHIEAVKETWRRSNWNEPTGQMLTSLSRLSKLSGAAIEFGRRRMLQNDVLAAIQLELADENAEDSQTAKELAYLEAQDALEADGPRADGYTYLGRRHGKYRHCFILWLFSNICISSATHHIDELAEALQNPHLYEHTCRFVFQQLYPELPIPGDIRDDGMPHVLRRLKLSIHYSASAVFYAPSELSGPGGMRREVIRATPHWFIKFPRYDTVLVTVDPDILGMMRFRVARVRQFLSFTCSDVLYTCAFVEWFVADMNGPDDATGMWVVRPEGVDGQRVTSIIALSSISRACHLMPVLGRTFLPTDFHFSQTLDAFRAYYVNCDVDDHIHETIL